MSYFEDYYEILQVHPLAEPEIIKAAYQRLAQKYHPDINKDPAANERMAKINNANEVLSDPEKRQRYHSEWLQNQGAKTALAKPKPTVKPELIRFQNVNCGETQRASFTISNAGGPYDKIFIGNPDSWVKVTKFSSLSESDELPMEVEIEATGAEWGKTYSDYIKVKLDNEEAGARVELSVRTESEAERLRREKEKAEAIAAYHSRIADAEARRDIHLGKLHWAMAIWLVPIVVFWFTWFFYINDHPLFAGRSVFFKMLVWTLGVDINPRILLTGLPLVASVSCIVLGDRLWSIRHNQPGKEAQLKWVWLVLGGAALGTIWAVVVILVYIRGLIRINKEYDDSMQIAEKMRPRRKLP